MSLPCTTAISGKWLYVSQGIDQLDRIERDLSRRMLRLECSYLADVSRGSQHPANIQLSLLSNLYHSALRWHPLKPIYLRLIKVCLAIIYIESEWPADPLSVFGGQKFNSWRWLFHTEHSWIIFLWISERLSLKISPVGACMIFRIGYKSDREKKPWYYGHHLGLISDRSFYFKTSCFNKMTKIWMENL